MSYRIVLDKEDFKFSVSHFTIFGADRAERLHGHNYRVRVHVSLEKVDEKLGLALDFNVLKPHIRDLMRSLDEYVLFPEHSPYLKLESTVKSVRAIFSDKTYELPAEDVRILPVSNVTCEELSRYLANELILRMKASGDPSLQQIRTLAVQVEESHGQSICFETSF